MLLEAPFRGEYQSANMALHYRLLMRMGEIQLHTVEHFIANFTERPRSQMLPIHVPLQALNFIVGQITDIALEAKLVPVSVVFASHVQLQVHEIGKHQRALFAWYLTGLIKVPLGDTSEQLVRYLFLCLPFVRPLYVPDICVPRRIYLRAHRTFVPSWFLLLSLERMLPFIVGD